MARHSHWHQIRLKKGITDKKRGKIFTRHAKLIAITASNGGGNPDMNPFLRMAIENARADNMPKDNIERAIAKGTREDKESTQFSEVSYEGFGSGGIAIVVQAVTDNTNRTLQSVRRIFEKHGGALGGQGSVSYLFEPKGIIRVKGKNLQEEDELTLIDCGAEDLSCHSLEDGSYEFVVFTAPSRLFEVRQRVESAGFQILSSELALEPKTLVEVSDKGIAEKILALIEALEEDDDVSKVSTNSYLRNLSR